MKPEPTAIPLPSKIWDRIGLSLSGLCAVHCLLMPVTVALLPWIPLVEVVHEWAHPVLALMSVPVTALAIWNCVRRHGPRHVPFLLGLGLALLVAAAVAHDALGEGGEAAVTVLGSGILIVGHWKNRCRCEHEPATHHACAKRSR